MLYPKYSSLCSPTYQSEDSQSVEYLTVDELLEKKSSTNEIDEKKDVSIKTMVMMMAIASTACSATTAVDDDWMNAEKGVSSSQSRCWF